MRTAANPLATVLITFAGIIYGFTFSLILSYVIKNIQNGSLYFNYGLLIILPFICFLLFDWLLSSYILLKSDPSLLWSYFLTIVGVPFIGISLYFVIDGYLYNSISQIVIGFKSFFIFIVFMLFYNWLEFHKLFDVQQFFQRKKIATGILVLIYSIVTVKIIFSLILFSIFLLFFVDESEYLVRRGNELYISYFIFKINSDFVLVLIGKY